MLDKFLQVAYRSSIEKTASRQLIDKLKEFPLEELKKLASGDETCKLAYGMDACGPGGSDNTWLGKYTGTPLFSKAVELEKALLQLDMEDQQARAQMPPPGDTWVKRDALQLQKRMLDLDLAMAENGGSPEANAAPSAEELSTADAPELALEQGGPPKAPKGPPAAEAGPSAEDEEAAALELAAEEAAAGGAGGAPQQEAAPPQAAPPKPKPKTPPKEEKPEEEGPPQVEVKQSSAKIATIIEAGRFLAKTAAPLTMNAREHIAPKNFAEPKADGPGDTGKYPIPDAKHAKSALGLVGMHGSDAEKSKVRAAVAKKFPDLEKDAGMTTALLGAAAGADKAHEAGKPGSGALRGAAGAHIGELAGSHIGRALNHVHPSAGLAGSIGGSVLGYKALTHKYNHKPDEKTAGLLGTALSAGKAAIPAIGGALNAGKSLATSAYKSGGLGQVASSFGNVAKNFAQKNPLAAAGVAGAGGMVAGKMLSNSQPRQ